LAGTEAAGHCYQPSRWQVAGGEFEIACPGEMRSNQIRASTGYLWAVLGCLSARRQRFTGIDASLPALLLPGPPPPPPPPRAIRCRAGGAGCAQQQRSAAAERIMIFQQPPSPSSSCRLSYASEFKLCLMVLLGLALSETAPTRLPFRQGRFHCRNRSWAAKETAPSLLADPGQDRVPNGIGSWVPTFPYLACIQGAQQHRQWDIPYVQPMTSSMHSASPLATTRVSGTHTTVPFSGSQQHHITAGASE